MSAYRKAFCSSQCYHKYRWEDYYKKKKTENKIICWCACGCGVKVKRRERMFASHKCGWKFKAEHKAAENKKLCLCGCGREVRNNLKDYASKRCAIGIYKRPDDITSFYDEDNNLTTVSRRKIFEGALVGDPLSIEFLKSVHMTRMFTNGKWINI